MKITALPQLSANKGSSSMLYIMELADYNRLYGKSYELEAGED